MNEFLIVLGLSLLGIALVVYLVHLVVSLLAGSPPYWAYRLLSLIGITLKVRWYYDLPKGARHVSGFYLVNIRSKLSSVGAYTLFFKFKRAYPAHEPFIIKREDGLSISDFEYIKLHTEGKTSLIEEANKGIKALKVLNDKYKYKYRIVDGKVI